LYLDAEQVLALANAITPRFRTLVLFGACTGTRAGECAALQVRHINPLKRQVTIEASISECAGKLLTVRPKNGKTRTITVPPFLADLLAGQCAGKAPDDYVFASQTDPAMPQRHTQFYLRHFRPTVQRALPSELRNFRYHDLRHTCASLMISEGASPKAVCDMLGHSSIRITMDRYGHLYTKDKEALAAKMDALYRQANQSTMVGNVVEIR
jgi:integrase